MTTKVFHDSELQQLNVADERYYSYGDDEYFPSVTHVLDAFPKGYAYAQWLKDLGHNADEVLQRAGEQGSRIHDAIDRLINGQEINWLTEGGKGLYSLEEWKMILKGHKFLSTYKPEILANEISLCSKELGFGGTIDLVCKMNGKVWLIDFKSSNAIYDTYELQLAAYAMMWNEKRPDAPIDNCGILWLKAQTRGEDKKGQKIQGAGWQLKEFDRQYHEAFKVFQHLQAIWKEINPDAKPKNLVYPSTIKL
jgi:hypothetical protein